MWEKQKEAKKKKASEPTAQQQKCRLMPGLWGESAGMAAAAEAGLKGEHGAVN